jgi:hypothetical protein
MNGFDAGILGLALASAMLLMLAWLIGVQGMLSLISNYRRHPEDFPDGTGLGRWMAWTLAAGGVSLGLCALALAAGLVPKVAVGPWAGTTGAAVGCLALGGIAKYRRRSPPANGARRPETRGRR